MSLNEKQKSKNLADLHLAEGICRSKSFTGLSHRHSSFSDVTFSSFDLNFNTCASSELQNSLGAVFKNSFSLNSAKNFIYALSKSSKIYTFPQPHNTQIFCDATIKGLRDSIHFAQNDISASRAAFDNVSVSSVMSQGKLYELEKQMKANERLLKKLEFHLSKVEELKEKYIIQNRMRDGIRTMAYAYILSPGKEKETALQNVKTQFKECSEFLCSLENTLESMIGTFLFELKGIQGFARICNGDIFEVVIKHGDQKWRSRGKVLKNGEQIWENKFMLFKALFCQLLYIKAVEVRGLGKNIMLGNKFCEIHDLFCAHPQQMTMNLNASGSLKLNLIITWNPLKSIEEGIRGATLSSLSGVPYSFSHYNTSQSYTEDIKHFSELALGKERFNYFETTCQDASIESAGTSISGQSSSADSPDGEIISSSSCVVTESNILSHDFYPVLNSSLTKPIGVNCNDLNTVSCVLNNEYNSINKEDDSHPLSIFNSQDINLTSVLKKLLHLLPDVIEQCPVVLELLNIVEDIEQLLKKKHEDDSDSINSISIESALGCFDFLDTAIEVSEFDASKSSEDSINAADHNINLQSTVNDKSQELNSTYSKHYSSGNDEIDVVLTDHLFHCTKLVSNLAPGGSMKEVSKYFLTKLKNQQTCLAVLQGILKNNNHYEIDDIFDEKEDEIRELWNSVAGYALYCPVSHMSAKMKSVICSKVALDNYMASIVCSRLILSMLDSDSFQPSSCISILQFKLFFTRYNNPYNVIRDIAADSIANH